MDWKERQTTKKKDDTVEKARLAREARAQQRQQVKPALALGRAARGFLARRRVARLCGERARWRARRRLLVEDALARPFALAVAAALAATDNAAAVLCDEDAVICWKVVNGAKQPVARRGCVARRELEAREGVVAPLADALIAKRDCAFLDASSAADDALDADLAGLSATLRGRGEEEAVPLADVVGSSRLLLASMPFALPFRVRLFQEKVCPDGQSNARAEEIRFFDASSPRPTDKTIAGCRSRSSTTGAAEAGIDAGGLFKEFWTELSGAAFSMDFGLFKTTAHDGLLFRTRFAFVHGGDHLRLFHFLGRVLKALREGITIQPRFTRSFLSFVRGDFNYATLLEDLKSLDPTSTGT
ncbi:ubiquitin-protein transferase [Aureococcus anophagefferens]|nr:ubiquitin-protein transferase [Aureococcus anophagefferens]